MNLDLTGKRALVCGSTQGIGWACALEMASLGAAVTLMARDAGRLSARVRELPPMSGASHDLVAVDLSQPERVREAISAKVASGAAYHILVNNTGGPPPGLASEATGEQFIAAINAQLISAQHLVQALLPGMKAAKYGRIINIISTSVKQPIPNLGVSNTVRAAVASWAKTLSAEVGGFGITVNNVLPGYTVTERLKALVTGRAAKAGVAESAVERELMATIPAGRFGEASEIGAAAAFLASPAAGYVNGINLPVDGGRLGCL